MKQYVVSCLVVLAILANSATASAEHKEHLSPWLAIAGATTVLVGVVMMLPAGDTYSVLGSDYCVQTYQGGGRVDAGACQAASSPHTALWVMGAGGAMMAVGLINVTVHPSRTGLSATATVKWGGRHNKK